MSKPVAVTDNSFDAEVLKSDLIVITDFWAEWCGPCKAIAPHLEAIASEYSSQVKVVKLDIDENPDTTSRYGVLSIPTLLMFKNGQEIARLVGMKPKNAIVKAFEPFLVVDEYQ